MKKLLKCLIIFFSIALLFLSNLPLLSMRSTVGESCTFVIRGYNLLEFSAWACVPLFAPLVILAISFSHQSVYAKDTLFLFLALSNLICYVHSVNTAKAWLMSIENSPIKYQLYLFVLPIGVELILILSIISNIITTKECDPQKTIN